MHDPSSVNLSPAVGEIAPSGLAARAATTASATEGFGLDIDSTLEWVRTVGPEFAAAKTTARWEALAAASKVDIAGARMLEPHADALVILAQAAADADVTTLCDEVGAGAGATWGVFAAEGAGLSVQARRGGGGWTLSGTKPWCSLANHLSHALVTAWTSADERRLFAVDLRGAGVHPHGGPWVSRGLAQVTSAPVDFDDAHAAPVGEDGWYLRRPGFAWGGVGVAAVWWGGALPLRDAVVRAAGRDDADQLADAYAGEADAASWAARTVLADAAARADDGSAPGVIAGRVRATVAGAAERILALADHALGPGPLTTDEDHVRRVGDLRIYLRQQHGARDLARLGRKLAAS